MNKVRLEVKNELLGDSIIWEGYENETSFIRSLPGRVVAEAVFNSGKPKSWGMWYAYLLEDKK